jgi:hypothetical protein
VHELRLAIREARRSVGIFAIGLGLAIALNLLGALAAPDYWRTPLFVAGALAAGIAIWGFVDALMDGHRLRGRLETLEAEAAKPLWLRQQQEQEALIMAQLSPPSSPV